MTPEREAEYRKWAERGYPADAAAMLREVLDALDAARARAERIDAERKHALEAVATVAQVNEYSPVEQFPRAIRTDNPFRAAVEQVGELRRRAQLAERLLDDAATSLETISKLAGKRGELLERMSDVRGYANSRAYAARNAMLARVKP